MTQYSYAQLEQLWINAGGPRALAPTMAAIAEAESSGNSNAYNASGASGLWQILGAVNPADQSQLFNPTVNAHEAVLKYRSQGLGAWVTYTSGAYLAFLNGSTTPDPNVPAPGATAALTAAEKGCLISFPNLNPLPVGGSTYQCLLSQGNARALTGGLLVTAGSLVAGVGVLILVATAFQRTGGLQKAADVAAVVPGGQGVAAGLQGAAARTSRGGGARAARNAAEAERRRRRQRDAAERADAAART